MKYIPYLYLNGKNEFVTPTPTPTNTVTPTNTPTPSPFIYPTDLVIISGITVYTSYDNANTLNIFYNSATHYNDLSSFSNDLKVWLRSHIGGYDNPLWLSTDYLNTATNINNQTNFPNSNTGDNFGDFSNVVNETGQYQLVGGYFTDNYLYYSHDYGITWSPSAGTVSGSTIPGTTRERSLAISSNGQYSIGTYTSDTYIHISNDYGVNVINYDTYIHFGDTSAQQVAMSSSGQYMISISYDNHVIISNDYGVSWTTKTVPTISPSGDNTAFFNLVDMSSKGDIIVIAGPTRGCAGNYLCISNDYGQTWRQITTLDAAVFNSLSISSSGQNMIVNKETYVSPTTVPGGCYTPWTQSEASYYSTDYGKTWTQHSTFVNGTFKYPKFSTPGPGPTHTPTQTPTVTPTATITQTPTPTHSTFYDVVFYDNTADNVCYNSAYGFSMSGNDTTFCNSTVFTSSGWYGVPTGTYYLGYGGNTRNVTHTSATNYATTYDGGCAACPVTPTPTPTNTQTHTTTPTPTPPPTYLYYSVDRRATCNTGIENPVAMFAQLPYAFTPTLNGWYRDSAGSCTYSYRISNITPTNPGIYTPVPVDAVTYADSTSACGSGCIPTPTPTPTPTTTPIITYNYYSITKYNCPGCTINTTGLFGRTTDPFTLTNGNYYNNGDGFVYLVNFGTAGPSYDVDLDGSASSGTNCPGTCSI